jgi:asparagine synthase (glutamine-hydrolysing)
MCGIAGICFPRSTPSLEVEATLERMLMALRHRGPDDRGWQLISTNSVADGYIGLANARLAILDLSPAGHQPMHDAETGNWIAFNGEIYNHLDLRKEIGARAGAWTSTSDTETVLRAYRLWGASCVERLRGMFAIAIWDARANALWCARDRLGIKPFYYYASDNTLLFASEVRAVLASGRVPVRLDFAGLAGYVRFGAVPEPLTLIENVHSLPAGHWMRLRQGRVDEIAAYWEPSPKQFMDQGESIIDLARRNLERAAGEHVLSDVPVACFLSGGIDSSIIAGFAAKKLGPQLHTFTLGFNEGTVDESAYAQAVAEKHGTTHHVARLSRAEIAAQVPAAVQSMDLPTVDGLNTYIISKAVADAGYKVVLSGLGGDELFGGYPSFKRAASCERWAQYLGRIPASWRAWLAGGGNKGLRAAELLERETSLEQRYACLRSLWSRQELAEMGIAETPSLARDVAQNGAPLAARVSILELTGYMRSMLLRDSDVLSMKHGLELRVPYLDHLLVEDCLRSGAACRNGENLPKSWLLKAAGDLLPEGIASRPKQGFALPMTEWMRGPLRGFVNEGLTMVEQSRILPRLELKEIEADFSRGRLHWSRVWQFVALGHWIQSHLSSTANAGHSGPE